MLVFAKTYRCTLIRCKCSFDNLSVASREIFLKNDVRLSNFISKNLSIIVILIIDERSKMILIEGFSCG